MTCAADSFYRPDWVIPDNVGALMSVRTGGVSAVPWDSANLGALCGDAPPHVLVNRRNLQGSARLVHAPRYLHQVHGADILEQQRFPGDAFLSIRADGHLTTTEQLPLAILTADCLPVLLCDEKGRIVAAVHAGWRGVYAGIIGKMVRELRALLPAGRNILAWIGPGIGPCCFEVGHEVRAAFMERDERCEQWFVPAPNRKPIREANARYMANLPAIAGMQLADSGAQVTCEVACTCCQSDRFFSYRRDGVTGRMAAMIWRK